MLEIQEPCSTVTVVICRITRCAASCLKYSPKPARPQVKATSCFPQDAVIARSPRLPFPSAFTVFPLGHMPNTPVSTPISALAQAHIAEHPCRNRNNVHPDSIRSRRASMPEPRLCIVIVQRELDLWDAIRRTTAK